MRVKPEFVLLGGALGWCLWVALGHPGNRSTAEAGSPSGFGTQPEDGTPPERPDEIGVGALLEEMVDRSTLARLPDPPYRSYLASSYDRRSVSPGDPAGWFANDDWASASRPNYLRVEEISGRREFVLLDAQGPGALVRMWSASPTGTLRIYVDGENNPVLAEPMAVLLSGKGSIPPPFAYVAALGHNLYFPIPFRRGCKVTVDELVAIDPLSGDALEKFYYQLNYRIYDPGAAERIRTFRRSDLARAAPVMARVRSALERPLPGGSALSTIPVLSEGGEAHAQAEAQGGVIRQLVLRPRNSSDDALRNARLDITFDDELTVSTPLGDFFGTGPGLRPYQSHPFEVRSDGTLISRWAMPFRQRAKLVVRNSPGLSGELRVEPWPWTERSLYFHARWRPTTAIPTRPMRDLRLISVEGAGLYAGSMFNLTNPPGARWWGEGDEKVTVDGERFPSWFGTGTEDYYGYAWSMGEPFARPFHAQTRAGGPGFDGQFSVNRFHALDAIPFARSLRFDLELWHWEDTRVTWDAVIYYYARPGAIDDAAPPAPGAPSSMGRSGAP